MPSYNDDFDYGVDTSFWGRFFKNKATLFGITLPVIFGLTLAIIGVALTATGVFSPVGALLTAVGINIVFPSATAIIFSGIISFAVGAIGTYAMEAVGGFVYLLGTFAKFAFNAIKSLVSSSEATNYQQLEIKRSGKDAAKADNSVEMEVIPPVMNRETSDETTSRAEQDLPPKRKNRPHTDSSSSHEKINSALSGSSSSSSSNHTSQSAEAQPTGIPKYLYPFKEFLTTEVVFCRNMAGMYSLLQMHAVHNPATTSSSINKLNKSFQEVVPHYRNITTDLFEQAGLKAENINKENFKESLRILITVLQSEEFKNRAQEISIITGYTPEAYKYVTEELKANKIAEQTYSDIQVTFIQNYFSAPFQRAPRWKLPIIEIKNLWETSKEQDNEVTELLQQCVDTISELVKKVDTTQEIYKNHDGSVDNMTKSEIARTLDFLGMIKKTIIEFHETQKQLFKDLKSSIAILPTEQQARFKPLATDLFDDDNESANYQVRFNFILNTIESEKFIERLSLALELCQLKATNPDFVAIAYPIIIAWLDHLIDFSKIMSGEKIYLEEDHISTRFILIRSLLTQNKSELVGFHDHADALTDSTIGDLQDNLLWTQTKVKRQSLNLLGTPDHTSSSSNTNGSPNRSYGNFHRSGAIPVLPPHLGEVTPGNPDATPAKKYQH